MADPEYAVRNVAPSGDWDARADAVAPGTLALLTSGPLLFIAVVLGGIAGYAIMAAPLSLAWQTLFALICFIVAVVLDRTPGRLVSIALMVLSTILSGRYIYWRLTESVDIYNPTHTWVDTVFAVGLILAELYAFLVLLLGYLQTLWPLQRAPVLLPRDTALWPSVDVLIPTLNEPVAVLRPTIIASQDMDWPRDRLHVYVLDDGKRPEVQALCAELGVNYVRRPDNRDAKAGNVNYALANHCSSEYLAIFDCDHVPTRSFLQVSLGWFLKDDRLAVLQTPHMFFSPDPFERNLNTFKSVPNEGELFYGLLQDGNDLWNATFFCGSCAVLRRSAVDEVGGLAVETVTEDAHTSLRLQRRGWNTAYINLPQAAGRATESLSAHVRQRIRWARGMSQIFRIDNPLVGRGLTLTQRLCYLNSMLYFFFGLPRIVFLTAPLAFLLFDARIIEASALVFMAYALPHLIHAQMTHSRLQGPFRYSFWAEVYETILCVYIVIPTFIALIRPKSGAFNVTAKGTNRERTRYDRKIAMPYLVLLGLNVAGLVFGIVKLIKGVDGEVMVESLALNMIWTLYNVVILAVCAAVAWEQREVRRAVRISAELPARVRLPDGVELEAVTVDLSEGGTMLRLPTAVSLPFGTRFQVALTPELEVVWIDADVTRSTGDILAAKFAKMSLAQERQVIYAIFGRADAWLHWAERRPPDKIGDAFGKILRLGLSGVRRVFSSSPGQQAKT